MKKSKFAKNLLFFYIPLVLLIIFALFPYLWTFLTSIKPEKELYTPALQYLPRQPTLENYITLFNKTNFFKSMGNSFLVAGVTSIISLLVSILAAYSFARFNFKGKMFFMVSFLLINMFPPVLLLTPLFTIMQRLNLLYTPYSLIIAYSTFTIPFSVWLLTGYIQDLPVSLEEAAMVDGCSRLGAFFRITLPLTIPGIIATGIYIFITAWNEFIFALMFTNEATRTLPVALQTFIGQFEIQWGLLTAGGVITTIPVVVLFMFVQKSLVEGLTAGAVKE
ncbi:ABC-type transporter, integral membrane subunit [Tepidanaerobacter acetatoxydans Re1]|uniref:ABC-type transporter, integral membrane subunit n=1 Tax=Tepidanaerobacter acetatoxydans (strain DSM 21804 / JCM 16047 / Re1) TaxID=1209989 RepID=F4LR65_TEPAE|nr:carbohydrate ABC transporter permease [Tepidanaerobacter acetatoxydans]AEE92218.1 ABC-type transporter, integral membrane subunit [Tepidanaerobacter acetatoxydans Re1]CCP27088.1 ABC-type transporter, integral membrane subunit [Tepidanaerobacter acetatoxydans Re1]